MDLPIFWVLNFSKRIEGLVDIEYFQNFCKSLPAVTEDIKWGDDLCFCVGAKMFCVVTLSDPLTISIKVNDDEFSELIGRVGISSAPYVAKYKWILVSDLRVFSKKEWRNRIGQSYELVKSKLSKKLIKQLGLN